VPLLRRDRPSHVDPRSRRDPRCRHRASRASTSREPARDPAPRCWTTADWQADADPSDLRDASARSARVRARRPWRPTDVLCARRARGARRPRPGGPRRSSSCSTT
jgi:hypothetical protein